MVNIHKGLQIILINHSIAFRIGHKVYINKALKSYPKLFKAILRHESEHTDGFSWKDVKTDLTGDYLGRLFTKNKDKRKLKKEYYKFIMKNPKALWQFSPFLCVDGEWSWDILMLLLWLLFLGILAFIWSLR